jgi:ribosomal protein S18 acetylase RimI-like enzyme
MKAEYSISSFHEQYLDDMVASFIESFDRWNAHEARRYLAQASEAYPDLCFAAINPQEECLGAIFCKEVPYQTGKSCMVEAIQVKKEFRNQGIGKVLLTKVVEAARKKGMISIGMLASTTTEFPLRLYESMGFHQTGWIELVASLDDINPLRPLIC